MECAPALELRSERIQSGPILIYRARVRAKHLRRNAHPTGELAKGDVSMVAAPEPLKLDLRKPINLGGREFSTRKYEYYPRILEEAPVALGKVSVIKVHLLARYDDCTNLLRDPRFVRNRSTATPLRRGNPAKFFAGSADW